MIYLERDNTIRRPNYQFSRSLKLAELGGIEPTHDDNEIKEILANPTESGAIILMPGKDGEKNEFPRVKFYTILISETKY